MLVEVLPAAPNLGIDSLCFFGTLVLGDPCYHPPQVWCAACVFFLRQHLYLLGSAAPVQLPLPISVSFLEPLRPSGIAFSALLSRY